MMAPAGTEIPDDILIIMSYFMQDFYNFNNFLKILLILPGHISIVTNLIKLVYNLLMLHNEYFVIFINFLRRIEKD